MAELRHVQIPKSIEFVVNGEKWTFAKCAAHVFDAHPLFSKGSGVIAAARILSKIEAAKELEDVALDQSDWKLGHDAFESPATGYIFALSVKKEDGSTEQVTIPPRAFISYILAWSDETTRKPHAQKSMNGTEVPALTVAATA